MKKITMLKLAMLAVLVGIFGYAMWPTAGMTQVAMSADPCAIYPHQSTAIPVGTPTSKLITGVLNKQIYICRVTVAQFAGATPGLTLSYGEVAAATPCATATPGATLGLLGANASTAVFGGDGSHTIYGPVPAAAGTPVVDVCGLTTTTAISGGSIDYVQR